MMAKLTWDEIRALSLEAAKQIAADGMTPESEKIDGLVMRLYLGYRAAKEIIVSAETEKEDAE